MRTSALVLAVFLLVLFSVGVSAQLTYRETDRIALNVSVFDPDSDSLRIAYSSPLNDMGEWQTTYGDAGVYTINVTVSDGTLSSTEEVVMIVNRKDEAPEVVSQRPRAGMISMREGKSLIFSSKASDKNNDAIEYVWSVDGKNISSGERFTYAPGYDDEGDHTLVLHITDGALTTVRKWDVTVRNVDLDTLIMSQYGDLTISENELVRIPLPDKVYYGIEYSISSPMENGYWKTDFKSSGIYKVSIHVFGKGYDETKTIRVTVLNVDQSPIINLIASQSTGEGKEISFAVGASDPDGEKISLSLKNAPKGATFSSGIFRWTPSYDTIQQKGALDRLIRNFHLLSKTFDLEFSAVAGNLSASAIVPLTVFNNNRAPVLGEFTALAFKEGEIFFFDANASDPDGDSLDISYESTLKRGQQIGFDRAGTHIMRIAVSDGFLKDEMTVPIIVKNTNRAPTLSIPSSTIEENKTLIIELPGKDEDSDPLTYSLIEGPEGMGISGSVLSWTPSFEISSKGASAVSATISVSDGEEKSAANVSINVENVNRKPILNEPIEQRLTAQRGVPITLNMNVSDPDSDTLSYTWRFGWFDSYKGDSSHARTFVTAGQKNVVVKATDGEWKVSKKIVISVL